MAAAKRMTSRQSSVADLFYESSAGIGFKHFLGHQGGLAFVTLFPAWHRYDVHYKIRCIYSFTKEGLPNDRSDF